MHSQEKMDIVEILVLQIPHPLQRRILSMKRVSVGFVGAVIVSLKGRKTQHPLEGLRTHLGW